MSAKATYAEALYRLSKSCVPEIWEAYMKAFDAFVVEELERSLRAPNEDSLIGLGWGRCLLTLRDQIHGLKDYEKKRNDR